MNAHLECPDRSAEQISHLFVRPAFHVLHDECFSQRRWKRRQRTVEVRPQLAAIQFLVRRSVRRWLVIFIVAEMRPAYVLEPVFATVCNDSKDPCIEASTHL